MSEDDRREIVVREFVRVPTSIDTRLVIVNPEGLIPHDGWVKGEIVEIGGGGARIRLAFDGKVGDAVSVRFLFPDTYPYRRLFLVPSLGSCLSPALVLLASQYPPLLKKQSPFPS